MSARKRRGSQRIRRDTRNASRVVTSQGEALIAPAQTQKRPRYVGSGLQGRADTRLYPLRYGGDARRWPRYVTGYKRKSMPLSKKELKQESRRLATFIYLVCSLQDVIAESTVTVRL